MSYILSDNISIIQIYNVCMNKCIRWDINKRNMCDTVRHKKMCANVSYKIKLLIEEKRNYVNITDNSSNEPSSKRQHIF